MSGQGFQEFLHHTQYADLPDDVIAFSRRCLLDLIGVMISGTTTDLTRLIIAHTKEHFAAGSLEAGIMFDGSVISPPGAALANGMMIDSIDAHDGFKPAKGHIGCHVLPTLLSFCQAHHVLDGKAFLASLVVGYEIGARAATALHASVSDYHTSGAWGAVTSAALGSRLLRLDETLTRHAIGIGEYHGPRSQMMRCIDHPTMLKDGSGWGAMAGVSATYLAKSGFTGAPALTVEGAEVSDYWSDLGERWTIKEQYFKAYPVCRWAQPAAEAALAVSRKHGLNAEDIDQIEVVTFHEGCRLAMRRPADCEQAQYSLPYPVAAALVFGQLGPQEISGDALTDPRVLRLSDTMTLTEHEDYNEVFPDQRYAHVKVTTKTGETIESDRHTARGDPEDHLTEEEIIQKFHFLADPVIGIERAQKIRTTIEKLGSELHLHDLLADITPPA